MPDSFARDVELLVRSRHAVLFVDTPEKDRAQRILERVADRLDIPFEVWTRTKGLGPTLQKGIHQPTLQPVAALQRVEQAHRPALYNFQGLGADLSDPLVATKLRDAARQFREFDGSIVITGDPPETLPAAVRPLVTVLELPPPHPSELRDLVRRLYRDLSARAPVEVHLTRGELDRLVTHLAGLTMLEAEKILTKAMVEDGTLDVGDLEHVLDAKRAIVERGGLLEYYPVENSMEDVAGLAGLKRWLRRRRAVVHQPERAAEFGLPFPKGVLLLGVQGAGKSLCAKAVAADWGLPLLKMDPAGLYNKYIGESERNFRRATVAAERMAPVVLWIDEIEKAFAQGGEMDGGVSQRVLGTFLSWLQERRGDVFVVATANDISKLPPELVRKGRFDEVFFVDLPDAEVRRAIAALHLARRGRDPAAFDLAALGAATEGFSGAEIEQVVVSALYDAFAEEGELTDAQLLAEANRTRPLAVTMAERVARLRAWAAERTVPAH